MSEETKLSKKDAKAEQEATVAKACHAEAKPDGLPVPRLKKLHVSSNMEMLLILTPLDPKSEQYETEKLCYTAAGYLEKAARHADRYDEELSFLFYKKFVKLMMLLHTRKNFSDCVTAKVLLESEQSALVEINRLTESLSERYQNPQEHDENLSERHLEVRKKLEDLNKEIKVRKEELRQLQMKLWLKQEELKKNIERYQRAMD